MTQHSMDEDLYSRIRDLCAKGNDLANEGQFEKACYLYRDALKLVPEPIEDWEATTWILASIGDMYFMDGRIEKAIQPFEDAVRCPGGLGNPFIHLRLGECYWELGQLDRAADELTRAYMAKGIEVFETEDPKYLQVLKTRIKPPLGQSDL